MEVTDRFWSKVDASGDCWEWTASRDRDGYGHFRTEGKTLYAHRVAYELLVGPIPSGLQIDHLCRVRACVNPAHLDVVASGVNTLRGFGAAGRNARRTSCPLGHPYDAISGAPGVRVRICKRCLEANHRRYQSRQRIARAYSTGWLA